MCLRVRGLCPALSRVLLPGRVRAAAGQLHCPPGGTQEPGTGSLSWAAEPGSGGVYPARGLLTQRATLPPEQRIYRFLEANGPSRALHIAKALGLVTAKDVNPDLYKMSSKRLLSCDEKTKEWKVCGAGRCRERASCGEEPSTASAGSSGSSWPAPSQTFWKLLEASGSLRDSPPGEFQVGGVLTRSAGRLPWTKGVDEKAGTLRVLQTPSALGRGSRLHWPWGAGGPSDLVVVCCEYFVQDFKVAQEEGQAGPRVL